MFDNAALNLPDPTIRLRFCVVLRGEYLLRESEEGRLEQMGFYVVRTTTADDAATAEKLALFDLEAEILMNGMGPVPDCLAIEKTSLLDEDQEDINSGFIFYPRDDIQFS